MMLAGRFFYGLGAETSIVVVSKILVKWFKGKDLALAFGLKIGFGRMGILPGPEDISHPGTGGGPSDNGGLVCGHTGLYRASGLYCIYTVRPES